MEYLFQIIISTIALASLYTLIGTGFSLRYSVSKYLDIGFAVYMTIGAYAYFVFSKYFGWSAVIYAIILTMIIAYFFERFYFAKLEEQKSSSMIMMIASLGFMTLMQAMIAMIFTSSTQGLRTDVVVFNIFSIIVTDVEVIMIVSTFVIIVALNIMLKNTKLGIHIRAINDNKVLAETSGIPIKKISMFVALLSTGMVAFAGILYGVNASINPLMGMSLLLSGVTAAIIAGVHNIRKIYIGGLILATIQNIAVWYIGGEWKDAVVFLLLIIILIAQSEKLSRRKLIRSV